MSYSVEMLSLSRIGDMLRGRLGSGAGQYLFPDDFERAVIDIGFKAAVIDGDASPYDEITVIGNAMNGLHHPNSVSTYYKKVTCIGTTSLPQYAFYNQTGLVDVVLNEGLNELGQYCFQNTTALVKNITLPTTVVSMGMAAFKNSGITGISAPGLTTLISVSTNDNGAFTQCANLAAASFPKLTNCGGTVARRGFLQACTGLQTVQLGSVDYPVTVLGQYLFSGCTSAFTVTVYTSGDYVDTAISNIRSAASAATIVIKAAIDTTYGGASYSAGDTIKTSAP